MKAASASANAEEADDASSPRDFLAKERICLLELKESRSRLQILRRSGYLDVEADPSIQESIELVKIVATIIRNSVGQPRISPWDLTLGIWGSGISILGFGIWDLEFHTPWYTHVHTTAAYREAVTTGSRTS